VAKEVVMKHGPDYYREVAPPVIERKIINESSHWSLWEKFPGRAYYTVTYPYDESVESFHLDFAARVWIWEDTGVAYRVGFGNNHGIGNLDDPEAWKGVDMRRYVMPYERQPPRERRDGERGGGNREGGGSGAGRGR